jgi:pSer/pThr/pTyr-binding forkhead associated (FHA) protein
MMRLAGSDHAVPEVCTVAIAHPRLQAEAPTQETGTLPRIPDRERRRAARTMPRLSPGRYLAIEDGAEVVLLSLDREFMHIGRSPASDIVLDDASVSRKHALIARRGERTVILDDRSRNGVHVNGVRVSESDLRDGDTILCGHVTLRFIDRAV